MVSPVISVRQCTFSIADNGYIPFGNLALERNNMIIPPNVRDDRFTGIDRSRKADVKTCD